MQSDASSVLVSAIPIFFWHWRCWWAKTIPESIIRMLCKIPVLVHSNVVSQLHLLPILFLHVWEHNTIAAQEENIRQPYRHPRKGTVSTLLFDSKFKSIPGLQWLGMKSTSVTVTRLCIVFSLLTTLSNCTFQYLHVYRTAKIQALKIESIQTQLPILVCLA